MVKKGFPIYTIANLNSLYIEVLLSEKKIAGIKRGSKAEIYVDAFRNKKYKGVVEAILPASASTFSLVPRDIASGEFTKLDQRFIVKIKLLNPDSSLKIGMGAQVVISKNKIHRLSFKQLFLWQTNFSCHAVSVPQTLVGFLDKTYQLKLVLQKRG